MGEKILGDKEKIIDKEELLDRQNTSMKTLIFLFRLEQEISKARLEKNYTYALELFDKIIDVKRHLPNRFGLVRTLSQKAMMLEELGFKEKALKVYEEIKQIAEGTTHKDLLDNIARKIETLKRQEGFSLGDKGYSLSNGRMR